MKRKVAVLGATGTVGQRFLQFLENHPWFKIEVLAASERSAGRTYMDACRWILGSPMPEEVKNMTLVKANSKSVSEAGSVDIVFSALPGNLAGPIEAEFANKYPVISKSKAHRYDSYVPLLIPEVNPEHLGLIPIQQKNRGWSGFISTDPNCSTIQVAMTLKPLSTFGIKKVVVSTMQALSGAGYPGVPSLDITDNVIPFISGEEEKVEMESLKILGHFNGKTINKASFTISASCNRVNVRDGHMANVFIKLEKKPTIQEVKKAFTHFLGEPQKLKLPTAHEKPIVLREEFDRPQPRFDKNEGKGMTVVVGRARTDPILTAKYVCLGHNTIRGAAGAGILSAELIVAKGYI